MKSAPLTSESGDPKEPERIHSFPHELHDSLKVAADNTPNIDSFPNESAYNMTF